jgi:hypothetical protein
MAMRATDALRTALTSTRDLFTMYLGDLSDADLLVRPVPRANHIAWQLGHLISAEGWLIKQALPEAVYSELPAGFAERHSKETAAIDPPKGFATKAEYLDLFGKAREATLTAVGRLADADLDRPTQGPMAKFAPTAGAMVVLVANHTLMHAGQFTVVRRMLGKPIVF